MALTRKDNRIRVNISIQEQTKLKAAKYAVERYGSNLSALISALLEDFNKKESLRKPEHKDQGQLI